MIKKNIMLILFTCLLHLTLSAGEFNGYSNYVYDASDFATEWIEYNPNGMYYDFLSGLPMDNPENVLSRPTVDTTGDDWYLPEDAVTPVNPAYSAFRANELLYLGEGGYVTVKFDHDVRDDENNPYGVDLVVFGKAYQIVASGDGWANGNPGSVILGSYGFYEPAVVSVSQDSITWYSFTNAPDFMTDDPNFIKLPADANDGPFCNSFAPTLGRVFDPFNPDQTIGAWNQYWAEPANPTFPVDPNLWFDSFGGYTLADMCEVYGNSAGGTGYDISKLDLPSDPETGKKWFVYVRVDDKANGGNAKLDAFSDISSCGDWKHPYPEGDVNHDCNVNLADFAILGKFWLTEITEPDHPAAIADVFEDASINADDLKVMAGNWLDCNWDCN